MRMTYSGFFIVFYLAFIFGLAGCQPEGTAEKAGQKIDKAAESTGQKIEKGRGIHGRCRNYSQDQGRNSSRPVA